MNKRAVFAAAVLPMLIVMALPGCMDDTKAKRGFAEEHLATLQGVAEDELTLEEAPPKKTDDYCSFKAHSSRFQVDFRVDVSQEDAVTDTYYVIALQEQAEAEFAKILEEALPGRAALQAVTIRSFREEALSGRVFSSIREAQEACPVQRLFRLEVAAKGNAPLSEEELSLILRGLRGSGLCCELEIAGDDRTFEIEREGVSYVRATGADGGRYIKRFEYPLES